jgi:hypothetical protein
MEKQNQRKIAQMSDPNASRLGRPGKHHKPPRETRFRVLSAYVPISAYGDFKLAAYRQKKTPSAILRELIAEWLSANDERSA